MQYINYAIIMFQVLIATGVAIRIGIILFGASNDGGEDKSYKKRIKNTIIFFIVSQGAIIIRNIIVGYIG